MVGTHRAAKAALRPQQSCQWDTKSCPATTAVLPMGHKELPCDYSSLANGTQDCASSAHWAGTDFLPAGLTAIHFCITSRPFFNIGLTLFQGLRPPLAQTTQRTFPSQLTATIICYRYKTKCCTLRCTHNISLAEGVVSAKGGVHLGRHRRGHLAWTSYGAGGSGREEGHGVVNAVQSTLQCVFALLHAATTNSSAPHHPNPGIHTPFHANISDHQCSPSIRVWVQNHRWGNRP